MTSRRALSLLSLLLLLAAVASAQTPAGPPRFNTGTVPGFPFLLDAAVDGLGTATVLWEPSAGRSRFYGRRFPAAGPPGPDFELTKARSSLSAAANERGDTVILWGEGRGSANYRVWVRRFSPGVAPLTLVVSPARNVAFRMAGDVAIDRAGRFVAVWTEQKGEGNRVHGQRFNADGSRVGGDITLEAPGVQSQPRIAMSPATGDFVIVWVSVLSGRPGQILGQRFSFAAGPQGSAFQVNVTDLGLFPDPDAGGADDGSFAVVWRRYQDTGPGDVVVEHFDAHGERSGGEVLAGRTSRFGGGVRLAVAPEGHFVVVWETTGEGEGPFQARLYHGDGTPAGPARELPGTGSSVTPEPAFGWNGTFVLAWTDASSRIALQSFAASPGAEPCLFRQGHFLCNTDSDPDPEIDHVFAVRSGTPVLGDVDGDGRDDYCLFRGTRFDCDSGHDNGAAEFTSFFGQPGDAPVIGDLDGDGRDEVCVFRAGTFLCDSARDGGAAETTLAFGQPGDQPALRDVDGDGRDEACVLRGTAFLCDTGHDGGAAETTLSAGEAGPLLTGNLDGL